MNFMLYFFLVGVSVAGGATIVLMVAKLIGGLLCREKPRYKVKLMHSLGDEVDDERGT